MLILAHRGAHEPESPGIRENTIEAFRLAAEVGADGVELDVRRSADGVLVIHHDPAPPAGPPIATTAKADLPGWIPTLADAMEACEGMALVNVELKASPLEPGFDPSYEVAADIAAALSRRPAGLLVSSFNLGMLDAFHSCAPEISTGWLTMTGFDQVRAARDAAAHGHAALNPPHREISPELLAVTRELTLEVVAWTVDDPDRLAELEQLGVEVVVTDYPARAVEKLRA